MQPDFYCLKKRQIPSELRRIASPPKQLYVKGESFADLIKRPRVAIVGSRSSTRYGRQVTEALASKLAALGVIIVSGLALGIDSIAHEAALDSGGKTIAVLPGAIDNVYPATNHGLSNRIISGGGALVSEYESGPIYKANFVARNRLIAALSDAVLITQAAEKSGSLHTARFALEQGKDVLAVPGSITEASSIGTNNLLKSGATLVTSYLDVLFTLGIMDHSQELKDIKGRNQNEQIVLDLLLKGVSDATELLKESSLSVADFNQVLTMLEIGGKIRSLGANFWCLS